MHFEHDCVIETISLSGFFRFALWLGGLGTFSKRGFEMTDKYYSVVDAFSTSDICFVSKRINSNVSRALSLRNPMSITRLIRFKWMTVDEGEEVVSWDAWRKRQIANTNTHKQISRDIVLSFNIVGVTSFRNSEIPKGETFSPTLYTGAARVKGEPYVWGSETHSKRK